MSRVSICSSRLLQNRQCPSTTTTTAEDAACTTTSDEREDSPMCNGVGEAMEMTLRAEIERASRRTSREEEEDDIEKKKSSAVSRESVQQVGFITILYRLYNMP